MASLTAKNAKMRLRPVVVVMPAKEFERLKALHKGATKLVAAEETP